LGIEGQGDRNGHPEGNLVERSLGSIVKVNRLSHLQGIEWFRAKVGINTMPKYLGYALAVLTGYVLTKNP
jgi:poly-beta-hydroxyalkanoate depolymerase